MTHEDQVISVVAGSLRQRGVAVLAEGANQMGAFRFILGSGRRKAPDLVFALDQCLFVFEAKVLATDLFRPAADGLSDFDVMTQLAQSESMQECLLDEAMRRLIACGRSDESVSQVAAGLLAGDSVTGRLPKAHALEILRVDLSVGRWNVEVSRFGDLLRCRAG